ncbi:MAG: sortase [Flexilinea sp.]|nr:sortase [Flexilinea sp.]
MKQKKRLRIISFILLMAVVSFAPVLAEDYNLDGPVEGDDPVAYEETGSLIVPDGSQTVISKEYVYVTGAEVPGIDMTAQNRAVSAEVSGEVFSEFGGAAITADAGTAALRAGSIHGGYGIIANLRNGGSIDAVVGNLFADKDTALDILIPGSGTLNYEGTEIISDFWGVTLLTGTDEEFFDLGPVQGDGEWIDPVEGNLTDQDIAVDNDPAADSGSTPQEASEGTAVAELSFVSVDAGETGVDIELNNASRVTLTGEAILSDKTGAEIELSGRGGTVRMTVPVIDAGNQGLVIDAAAGEVTVNNSDFIGADSAVEITNGGGTVSLPEGGALDGNSGIYVEATGGTTTAKTGNINAQNYGISVWTYAPDPYVPFEPDEDTSENEAQNTEAESGETSGSGPVVKITVDGEISDQIDMTLPEEDWGVEPDPESAKGSAAVSFGKDISESGASDGSEAEGSVGIVVDAETESDIEINVYGMISMCYGNEIEAFDNSKADIFVQEDVVTDYGNRISSSDGAEVKFTIGGDIDAGGKALETYADSGNIEITVENITVQESDDAQDTAGIYATSEGSGKTSVIVNGSIAVSSENRETETSGINIYNTGDEISISVGNGVAAKGSGAVGLELTNETYGDPSAKTNVEISGNLTGTSKGLVFDTTDATDGNADILVTDTISGGDVSVEVGNDATPENFDLTVWKIEKRNGHAASTPDGDAADEIEPEIKYIIRIDPGSEEKIEAVYEDGSAPLESHGYPYQKENQKIYVRGINGYTVTEAYNGKDRQTALAEDENGFYLEVPKGGAIWLSAERNPRPGPEPAEPQDGPEFFGIGDLSGLFDAELPATGFSSSHMTELRERPQGLEYKNSGLMLQIPVLGIAEWIQVVPEVDGDYPVEWLGSNIGLLEQSSLPGKGISVLTGHNHLNMMEAGPFLFIRELEQGDRMMILDRRGRMQTWQVYGNYRIPADGFASLKDQLRDNALVLITCEDESMDGGYLNRRVVLAEPL